MQKIAYPLEQLTTIKQKKLEEAEKVLQAKKEILAQEQKKLHALEKERDKVKDHKNEKLQQLRDTLDQESRSPKIQQMKAYLKVVQEELLQKELKVKEQQKQVDAAQKQVDLARQELFHCQQDVEKMRLHRQEWEKEMRLAEERQAAIENDEIGSVMHTLNKARNTPLQ